MTALHVTDLPQILLAAAALALALWCAILARRLRRLNDLESGLGGAIAVMAAEVARLEAALARARADATEASEALGDAVERARAERARWAVQSRLAAEAPPRPRTRRRRETGEVSHAEA